MKQNSIPESNKPEEKGKENGEFDEKQYEKVLSCAYCRRRFDNLSFIPVHMKSCGHTVCNKCIISIEDTSSRTERKICPVDNKTQVQRVEVDKSLIDIISTLFAKKSLTAAQILRLNSSNKEQEQDPQPEPKQEPELDPEADKINKQSSNIDIVKIKEVSIDDSQHIEKAKTTEINYEVNNDGCNIQYSNKRSLAESIIVCDHQEYLKECFSRETCCVCYVEDCSCLVCSECTQFVCIECTDYQIKGNCLCPLKDQLNLENHYENPAFSDLKCSFCLTNEVGFGCLTCSFKVCFKCNVYFADRKKKTGVQKILDQILRAKEAKDLLKKGSNADLKKTMNDNDELTHNHNLDKASEPVNQEHKRKYEEYNDKEAPIKESKEAEYKDRTKKEENKGYEMTYIKKKDYSFDSKPEKEKPNEKKNRGSSMDKNDSTRSKNKEKNIEKNIEKKKGIGKDKLNQAGDARAESYFINHFEALPPVVATINSDCDLEIKNLNTANNLAILKNSKVFCMVLIEDYVFACGLKTGEVAIIDIKNNRLHEQYEHYTNNPLILNYALKASSGNPSPVTCIIKHNTKYLLSSNKEGKVVLWNYCLSRLCEVQVGSGKINSLVFVRKDSILCINNQYIEIKYIKVNESTKKIKNIENTKNPKSLKQSHQSGTSVDSYTEKSDSYDSELLSKEDFELLESLSCGEHQSEVNCIKRLTDSHFNYLGKVFPYYMVSAGEDQTIRFWNYGTCLKVLHGHEAPVKLVIQVNSNCIASLDTLRLVLIWNVLTGTYIQAKVPNEDAVGSRIDCIERINNNSFVGFYEKAFVIWEKEGNISYIVEHNIKFNVVSFNVEYMIMSLWESEGKRVDTNKKRRKEKKPTCNCCVLF
mmetsp:Transcript_27885/g.29050  ORF Transcript_27885/g.29050 Transcript_27885/m.29050 type:complete len:870 (-) Transcript_27885:73-2682(-)